MINRPKKAQDTVEAYTERFDSLGLELPGTTRANEASVHNIASFLLKYKVFENDEETLKELLAEEKAAKR